MIKLAKAVTGFLAASLVSCSVCYAQSLAPLTVLVFGPPSLGAFLPPIIKNRKFDEKNGLAINFVERTPDAYSTQFNSGEFQVGGSASLVTIGLAAVRGVKVTYLFNLYDYWSYVVTSRPEVKTLKDLEGKELAVARGTTIFVMFEWFARQQGVDMSKIALINTAPPGLLGYALADRAAGIHIWDPGYTTLMQKNPSLRSLDLDIHQSWEKFTGTRSIPYLGVAAHTEWVEKNPQLVPKLYATYKDAVDWTLANPDEASSIIISTGTANEQKAVADLIRANDRLGLNIQWAADLRKELLSVYRVGREMGILPSEPGPETIYTPHAK